MSLLQTGQLYSNSLIVPFQLLVYDLLASSRGHIFQEGSCRKMKDLAKLFNCRK